MYNTPQHTVIAVATSLSQYHQPLLDGMRMVLAEQAVALLAYVDDPAGGQLPPLLLHLLNRPGVCGLITTSSNSAEQDAALVQLVELRQLPVVHIGQNISGHAGVQADNRQAMAEVMRLVLDDCGAKRLAFARGLVHQPDHVLREEVFREEIARRGLEIDEELIIEGASHNTTTKQMLRQLLARRTDMDAVVCVNDGSALGAIDALTEAGLRVPTDVVVTGFDNDSTAAINWPSVTTVDQHLVQQGAAAARMILDARSSSMKQEHVLVPCELVPRDSTAVGRASAARVAPCAEQMAHQARAHMMAREQLLWTARALKQCRSLEEVCAALPAGFTGLDITRAFLVIYQHSRGQTWEPSDPVDQETGRLVFDFRDGVPHPVPPGTFAVGDLLPEHLRSELRTGYLAVKLLNGSAGPLGYLVLEQRPDSVPIVESLAVGVSGSVDVILSTEALEQHSASLEEAVLRRTRELAAEVAARRRVEEELRTANAELEQSVVLDGLTSIANRTALYRHLDLHWPAHVSSGSRLAVMMVDIDFFKAYNDEYGHLRGDEALQTVALCLGQAARYPNDLVCRFGGEEFLLVLPFSGERSAMVVAKRFAKLLEVAAIPHAASPVAPVVTASIGIATVAPEPGSDPQSAIDAADQALYQAKRTGRNRISTNQNMIR